MNKIHRKYHQMQSKWFNVLGHHKIVEILLKNGADVNALQNDGFTALNFATLHGNCQKLIGNWSWDTIDATEIYFSN